MCVCLNQDLWYLDLLDSEKYCVPDFNVSGKYTAIIRSESVSVDNYYWRHGSVSGLNKTVLWTYKDTLESRLTYHVVVDDLLEAFSAFFQAFLQRQ